MNDHLDVLKVVVERLERAGIEYMLTGSLALSYYAEPRFTRDVDLIVALSTDTARSAAALFADDFYVDAEAVVAAAAREGMVNIIHSGTIVKVDLIVRKSTPHHLEEFERRRRARIDGLSIWIVSLEDLLLAKLLWLQQGGSDVHKRDVALLLRAAGALDRTYVLSRVAQLGLEAVWREVSGG